MHVHKRLLIVTYKHWQSYCRIVWETCLCDRPMSDKVVQAQPIGDIVYGICSTYSESRDICHHIFARASETASARLQNNNL